MERGNPSPLSYVAIALLSASITACDEADGSTQGRFEAASVKREGDGKLTVSWSGARLGNVDVYWSTSSSTLAEGGTVLVRDVTAGTVTFDDPSPSARPYFELRSEAGATIVVAERTLPMASVPNFRDVGGYTTTEGRTVRWGRFFRSKELAAMTAADREYVRNSGVKSIIDYRSDAEVAANPDPVIDGIRAIRLPVVSPSLPSSNALEMVIAIKTGAFGAPGEMMIRLNEDLVNLNTGVYSRLLEYASDQSYLPLIQHCTAGKDRAGFGAAITLLALGVPRDTVMQDYLLSREYLAASNQELVDEVRWLLTAEELEVVVAMLDVREQYLEAALDEIELKHGSISAYLEQGLGLTPARWSKLREAMLE